MSHDQIGASWRLWGVFALCVAVLVIIPFVLFGDAIETQIAAVLDAEPGAVLVGGLILGLLALDAPLPVPSSLVALASGAYFGPWIGGALIFAGLTIGAVVGYALGHTLGRLALARFTNQPLGAGTNWRLGPGALIVTRGIPVLSETATITAGAMGYPLARFLPPVLLANAGIAALFGITGAQAVGWQGFLLAFGVSIAAPLVCYLIWRRFLEPSNISA